MKRPADQAMYIAIRTHNPRRIWLCFSLRAPRHNNITATIIAINETIGPYDAKRTPLLGACASPIVPNILFLEK